MCEPATAKPTPREPVRVAIAVILHLGCVLVGTRDATLALAGKSEFPGGKVHANEAPASAAVRETREETGLHVRVIRLRQQRTFDYPHAALELHFFDCALQPGADLPSGTFRWVPLAELSALDFPAANRSVVAELCKP